jgi:hypothetical protein
MADGASRFRPRDDGPIIFKIGDTEVLRFESNGNIFIQGRAAAHDREVVDAMREFLRASGRLR